MPKSEEINEKRVASRLLKCKESEIEIARWLSPDDFMVLRATGQKDHFTFEQFKAAERGEGATAEAASPTPAAASPAAQRTLSGAPERIRAKR